MQAPLNLSNLIARGIPMAEAKAKLGIVDEPSDGSVSAGVSGGTDDKSEASSQPADTTPDEPADAPPVDAEAKPAWMP